ncbi:hypothetical protein QBC44DRAFT_64269 [Cladorrhinum sp. PSN332]|nr:hypothetical protein QBC44DRAFT_64269 [Cladorrhinum sp. PSN332]
MILPRVQDAAEQGLPSQAKEVISYAIGAALLSGIFVLLRFYTRGVLLRVLGLEDCCLGLSMFFSIGNTIGMCLQANTALGRPIQSLSNEVKQLFFKEVYFTIISYNVSIALVKLSILLLYLRVFTPVFIRKSTYTVLVAVLLLSLWSVLSTIFFCIPVARFWDRTIDGSCLPRPPRWISGAIFNIASDFAILVLPLSVVRRLSIPTRQKIGLYLVFALGFFVCIVSVVRLPFLITAAKSKDPTRDNSSVAKWSSIELNTAIICACLTTLKPLLLRIFPSLFRPTNSHRHIEGSHFEEQNPPSIGRGGGGIQPRRDVNHAFSHPDGHLDLS